MRVKTHALLIAGVLFLALLIPSAAGAQHKHTHGGQKSGGKMAGMSTMMKSPHHMLMMAHMKSMSEFATTLRDQAVKPGALDEEFARGAVAELRHNLDAMEAIHQKHMQGMTPEMKTKMKMMMDKMDKDSMKLKDQVAALETDVQAASPDSKLVVSHTNALLKHLGMMSMMNGEHKPAKKMEMKKDMEMKKM